MRVIAVIVICVLVTGLGFYLYSGKSDRPASGPAATPRVAATPSTADPRPSDSAPSSSSPSSSGRSSDPTPSTERHTSNHTPIGGEISRGDYPTYASTGPQTEPVASSGTITTTRDGQIIENVTVNGRINVRHDDVVIRNVVVMGTETYAIDIGRGIDPCPTSTLIEFTEVNMMNAPTGKDIPIYDRCSGGTTLDHVRVLNTLHGVRTAGNFTMRDSWIFNNRTLPGAHRSALSTHGGDNFRVTHNTFICELSGCSSAVNMYSDYGAVTDYLFKDNLLAGGGYCLRGGETHRYRSSTQDIRIINNRFSTRYHPECGQFQAIGQFDSNGPGNAREGNVFYESGVPVPGG